MLIILVIILIMFEFTSSVIILVTDDTLHNDLDWYRWHVTSYDNRKWNIDEPGDEHIIDEDFHGESDENLFQDLVVDDILDPDLNTDIPNMDGARQGAGQ